VTDFHPLGVLSGIAPGATLGDVIAHRPGHPD
jgi:hypothetical protein